MGTHGAHLQSVSTFLSGFSGRITYAEDELSDDSEGCNVSTIWHDVNRTCEGVSESSRNQSAERSSGCRHLTARSGRRPVDKFWARTAGCLYEEDELGDSDLDESSEHEIVPTTHDQGSHSTRSFPTKFSTDLAVGAKGFDAGKVSPLAKRFTEQVCGNTRHDEKMMVIL